MEQNKKVRVPAIGGSSLLVVFTVLCLTLFAVLGLGTVQANIRLTDAAAEAVSAYYAADTEAEIILARLRRGDIPETVTRDGDVYQYSCPVTSRQMLAVAVRLTPTDYEVLRWQVISTAKWEADDSIHVWQGDEAP